jgi:hypothetical protein
MFRIIITSIFTFIIGCTDFSSQFERVENNRVRLIDFIYEPADAAPGDTVHLKALFAGKEITPEDIDWKVSYKLAMNNFGFDSAFDEQPLDYIAEPCSTYENSNCIALRFVIPKNCIQQSPMVLNDWLSSIPEEMQNMLPPEMATLSKAEMVDFVDSLSNIVAVADSGSLSLIASLLPEEIINELPLITQLLTAKIRLYAYVKDSHRIKSDYTVSYNHRFARIPGIGVYDNKNPTIDSIGVYKVKGENLMKFERDGDSTHYTTIWTNTLADSDATIEAENGYSYFLEAFVSGRDSVVTLSDIAGEEPYSFEDMSAEWMFQMDEEEMDGCTTNDFMNVAGLNDLTAILYLPLNEKIKKFTIWVQVTDSKLNVLNRSQGSMVTEIHGTFSYIK